MCWRGGGVRPSTSIDIEPSFFFFFDKQVPFEIDTGMPLKRCAPPNYRNISPTESYRLGLLGMGTVGSGNSARWSLDERRVLDSH